MILLYVEIVIKALMALTTPIVELYANWFHDNFSRIYVDEKKLTRMLLARKEVDLTAISHFMLRGGLGKDILTWAVIKCSDPFQHFVTKLCSLYVKGAHQLILEEAEQRRREEKEKRDEEEKKLAMIESEADRKIAQEAAETERAAREQKQRQEAEAKANERAIEILRLQEEEHRKAAEAKLALINSEAERKLALEHLERERADRQRAIDDEKKVLEVRAQEAKALEEKESRDREEAENIKLQETNNGQSAAARDLEQKLLQSSRDGTISLDEAKAVWALASSDSGARA